MAKPIIKTINPFDATTSKYVSFVWTGSMAYNNRMIIYDAQGDRIVYDHTYSTNYYKLDHEIPAGTLANGVKYAVQVAVIGVNGDVSAFSDKYYFETTTAPTFYFEDLLSDSVNIIHNAIYTASLYYEQSEGAKITSYQFFLLNSAKEVIASSAVMTDSKMTYVYRSLENGVSYYLRATGVNSKNMELDTGYIMITASYDEPSFYSRIEAKVNEIIGTVDYRTNIVDIESDRPDEEYDFDEDGFIDLVNPDPNKTLSISWEYNHPMTTPMVEVEYIDADGIVQTKSSSEPFDISYYKEVIKFTITGSCKCDYAKIEPTVGGSGISYTRGGIYELETFNLIINDNIINVTDIFFLKGMDEIADTMTIYASGERVLHKVLDKITIGSYDNPASISSGYNKYGHFEFTAMYNIGATDSYGHSALYCGELPVLGKTSTTAMSNVRLTSDGLLAVTWDETEFNVRNLDTAREWLYDNPLRIIYPMSDPIDGSNMDSIPLPSLENVNTIRYSKNFLIPKDSATISLRIKNAYQTQDVLKLQDDNGITTVLVSSRVYEDGTLRFKLTAYGTISDYIIYSEPLVFNNWDVVTLHVRRLNGIYGLYAFITEGDADPKRNYWFIETEPFQEDTERGDVWINKQYDIIRIDKDDVVRHYQDEEPIDVKDEDIWIGN